MSGKTMLLICAVSLIGAVIGGAGAAVAIWSVLMSLSASLVQWNLARLVLPR